MRPYLLSLLALVLLLAGTAAPSLAGKPDEAAPTAGVSLLDRLPDGATHAADIKPAETEGTKKGVVDVFTRLNVRSGPGLSYGIIGKLNPGDEVTILETKDDWMKIKYGGGEGWVCGYYIWTPGKGVRNSAIRSTISQSFPGQNPGSRSSAEWSGEPGGSSSSPGSSGYDPGPSNVPSGPQVGQRQSDGGLAVPLMNQNRIGARYPSGFCGPTSLKMTLAYYGINKDINYLGLQDVGGATPVYRRGQGAGHQAMLDMLKHCGLGGSTMNHGNSIAWLKQQTDAGKPVVVSVRGNYGPRSTNGHILVVVGVTRNGDVIINDSAGGQRHVCPARQFYSAWSSSSRMAIVAQR